MSPDFAHCIVSSPVVEIFKTPGMAIAIPAILVLPPRLISSIYKESDELDFLSINIKIEELQKGGGLRVLSQPQPHHRVF